MACRETTVSPARMIGCSTATMAAAGEKSKLTAAVTAVGAMVAVTTMDAVVAAMTVDAILHPTLERAMLDDGPGLGRRASETLTAPLVGTGGA